MCVPSPRMTWLARCRTASGASWAQQLDPAQVAAQGPRAIKRRDRDADQVDEAASVLEALGGPVWAGDVAEVETSDPTFWNASTYELTYRIESVCQAEVGDELGRFSFSVFFLDPHQGADVRDPGGGPATDGAGVPGRRAPRMPWWTSCGSTGRRTCGRLRHR